MRRSLRATRPGAPALFAATLLALPVQAGAPAAWAQSHPASTATTFRPTGDAGGVARTPPRGSAEVSEVARTAVGLALGSKQSKDNNSTRLAWISLERLEALAAAVGHAGSDVDALQSVHSALGADGVDDLKRLIVTYPPGTGTKLIPASAPSSGPGALIIDTLGREGREEPAKWVGTIYLVLGTLRCTATLVGPQTLLTAAHCLEAPGPYAIEINGRPIALRCDKHPSYRPFGQGVLYDYGLCHLASEFPREITIRPQVSGRQVLDAIARIRSAGFVDTGGSSGINSLDERLRSAEHRLAVAANDAGDPIAVLRNALVGDPDGSSPAGGVTDLANQYLLDVMLAEIARPIGAEAGPGGLAKVVPVRFERLSLDLRDSVFRTGDVNARRILLTGYGCTTRQGKGGNDNALRAGQGRISLFSLQWLAIGSPQRGDSAILCSGDSGGAAYRLLDNDTYGRRVIVAVNVQNINTVYGIQNVSFVARTAAPAFRAFFEAWRRKWGRPPVCGVDREIGPRCHD